MEKINLFAIRLSSVANKLLKYGVAAILLMVPLYPKFPFLRLPGVQVAVRLEDFVVLIVLIIWVLSVLPRLRSFLKDKNVSLILLFFAIGLVAIFGGIYLTKTVEPYIGLLHWARRVEYLSLFFIGASSLGRKEDLYFYLKILLIVVVIVFFYGIGQKYFNVPVITTQNEEYSRGVALRYMDGTHLVSTFAGHYDLASFVILIFPSLYLFLTSPKETLKKFIPDTHHLLTRGIVFVISLMSLWLLVQTASRISLASYLVSSVFALILMQRKKFIPLILILSFVFAALSSNLVDRYLNIIDVYAQEATTMPTPLPIPIVEDRSTSIRLNVEWPRALRALTKNPLTGTGYSSISLATDNDYLRMLGETGILGFLSLMLILGNIALTLLKALPKAINALPENQFLVGLFAALPGIALNMVFIDILEASKFAIMFWLLSGFAVSLATKHKNEDFN